MNTNTKPVLVLLSGLTLTDQNVFRSGVETFEKFFEVVVLDCRKFLKMNIDPREVQDSRFRKVVTFGSAYELQRLLGEIQPVIAIDLIGPCPQMKIFQSALKRINCKLVIQKLGVLPSPGVILRGARFIAKTTKDVLKTQPNVENSNFENEIYNPSRTIKFLEFLRRIINHRRSKYFGKADFAVASGRKALKCADKLASRVKSVRSLDSFTYLGSEFLNPHEIGCSSNTGDVAVFIDDALVHASDWSLLKLGSPVDRNSYFRELNLFFSKVEKTNNVRVIIAGHPSCIDDSDYVLSFSNRPVIFQKTPALVNGSKFVIAHCSTGISYAVLAKKPIMFITNSELLSNWYGARIKDMAKACGNRIVNIDNYKNKDVSLAINSRRYEKYIENYIHEHGTDEISPWEGLLELLESQREFRWLGLAV